jgi:competence protein ComEA
VVDRTRLAAAAALLLVAVLAGAWFGMPPPLPPPPVVEEEPPPGNAATAAQLVVHVSGWVLHPGLVRVADGARVADVVAAAGGARPGAALGALNLAAPVSDGEHVAVPGPGSLPEAPSGGGGSGPLDINTATAAELEQLPGVGPVLAERIVAHREQHGRFDALEDLLDVPGIGEAKLAAIRDALEGG